MFQIIGWIAVLLALGYGTIVHFFLMVDGLGKYNIGAVRNSLIKKILLIIGAFVIAYLWYLLFAYAPFTI